MHRLRSNESGNRRKLQLLGVLIIMAGCLVLYLVYHITSNAEKSIMQTGKNRTGASCWIRFCLKITQIMCGNFRRRVMQDSL